MPDYGGPNTQMMQYGLQMIQPRPPGYQNLPWYGQGTPQMQNLPYSGGQSGQLQELASPPGGKRRVRIGNKTYVEEDDTAAAPSTQIGSRSY
jgi:hypothetical protein